MNSGKLAVILLCVGIFSGCASRSASDQAQVENGDPRDPFESVNREVWDFNYNVLDEHVIRPVTVGYITYMPKFARTGLLNMANNLEEPANSVNNLLQGKLDGTLVSITRFLLNSTLGLLGAIDVAEEIGLTERDEDFGEVLGKWGIGTGAYLMLPALGPNDVRSGTGDIVDSSYFPLADLNIYFSLLRASVKALEARAALMEQEQLLESSLDPYAFVKNAYFQNLKFKVTDGEAGEDELPEEEVDIPDDIDALLEDL